MCYNTAMYIHIGGTCTISDRYILGIYNLDLTTSARTDDTTRRFLARMEEENRVVSLSDDLPKSFIVTLEGVFLSPVSVSTLKARLLTGGLNSESD
ncbi:MAG: extracellular matrix regulator RemB [Fastidiosipilaceae bacterium]|nr:DUF370 domain-containing protein [Clostridiaceae bacterium]